MDLVVFIGLSSWLVFMCKYVVDYDLLVISVGVVVVFELLLDFCGQFWCDFFVVIQVEKLIIVVLVFFEVFLWVVVLLIFMDDLCFEVFGNCDGVIG